MNDWGLLVEYRERRSEAAFEALVQRYMSLVYGSAFRQIENSASAQDVTQMVFILLARKAEEIKQGVSLAGWLLKTTHFVVRDYRKTEARRRLREEKSIQMKSTENAHDLEHVLDELLLLLPSADREALLLRFFDNKSMKELGAQIGTSENGAQQRVSRSLNKLRNLFSRKGYSVSAAVLAALLTQISSQAAPVTLSIPTISAAALKGAGTYTVLNQTLHIMAWTKLKTAGLAACLVIASVGTTTWIVEKRDTRQKPPFPEQRPSFSQSIGSQMNGPASNLSPAANSSKPFRWMSIESADYKEYIANLRNIGCPEETIRDIVEADLNKYYSNKLSALNAPAPKYEYWKVNPTASMMPDPATSEKRKALFVEKNQTLQSLLGIKDTGKTLEADTYGDLDLDTFRFSFLSKEKQELLDDISKAFISRQKEQLRDPDAKAVVPFNEIAAAWNQVLSPEEQFEMKLRVSPQSDTLREDLSQLKPSEEEFRKIFQIRDQIAAEGSPALRHSLMFDAMLVKEPELQQRYDQQLQGILGQPRFEAYQKSIEANIRKTLGEQAYQNYLQMRGR